MKKIIILLSACCLLSACSSTPKTPQGFEMKTVETEHFSILTFHKNIQPKENLRIYIEGDGNPNPKKTTALSLAQKDTYQNVVYITRPCQFNKNEACNNPDVYGTERFHPEILFEMQDLIQYLGQKYQAKSVELIGYDGGATIALLLATRLPIQRVITVAGILDTDAYTQQTKSKEMPNALNPAREKNALAMVPQIHYVGADDTITPRRQAERFVARLNNPISAVVKVVPDTGHTNWDNVTLDYYQ